MPPGRQLYGQRRGMRGGLRLDLDDAIGENDHVHVALLRIFNLGGASLPRRSQTDRIRRLRCVRVESLEIEAPDLVFGDMITPPRHAHWDPERSLYCEDVHRVRYSIFQDDDRSGSASVEAGSR